jgi:hypothetical protein
MDRNFRESQERVRERYILVLGMRSKQAKSMEHRAKIFTPSLTLPPRRGGMGGGGLCSVFFFMLFVTLLLFFAFCPSLFAGIKDRVVAFVGNDAITLSELEKTFTDTLKITPNVTRDEVLNTMVNRLLLLREAKKIRLEAPSEDELLREYIDMKIRAFIRIREEELTEFYEKHLSDFQGKEFESVRDEIENYLIENALNQRLKSHINELREKACIKIQLNQDVKK